jgi:hypothetical protein|tara:strand:- start:1751 stop:2050 length:300 start_codon:yes stop_codon:yes gene_type:complete
MGKRVKSSNKKTISLRQFSGFGGARLSVLTIRNPKTDWMQSDDRLNVVNLSKTEAKKLANDLLAWVNDTIEDDHEWPSLQVQEEVWNEQQRRKQRKLTK